MRDDDCGHAILIIKIVIEFLEIGLPIVFLFDLFGIVIEVQGVGAGLQFLEKLVFELSGEMFGVCSFGGSSCAWGGFGSGWCFAGYSWFLWDLADRKSVV